MIKNSILILWLFLISSCSNNSRIYNDIEDIYNKIPKKSALSKYVIKNSEQIYPYESGLIFLFKNQTGEFTSDHYLIFFDENLRHSQSCYLSAFGITNMQNDSIVSYQNSIYLDEKGRKRNDLPSKLSLSLIDYRGGVGGKQNKMIEAIEIIEEETKLERKVKITFLQGGKTYYRNVDELKSTNELVKDSIILDSKNIYCNGERLYVVLYNEISNVVFFDYYMPTNREQLDFFYQPFLDLLEPL